MLVLSVDCSLSLASVAVMADGRVLAERTSAERNAQAHLIAPMLEEVLAFAEAAFENIGLLAVTTGPGSFTGIRIGMAAAKGLQVALDKPLVGVSVFEAAAYPYRGEAVTVLVDTRRDDFFFQAFDTAGQPSGIPGIVKPEQVRELEGKLVYADREPPLAVNAAKVALEKYDSGDFTAEPLYIRQADVTVCAR